MESVRKWTAAVLVGAVAAAVSASPPQQPIVVQGLDCRGDDPSWRLDANRASAVFTAQAPRKREVVFRGSLQTLASVAPPTVVWRGDTTHLPRETLILTAREEACTSPAGAGNHRAIMSIRAGEAVTGCCLARAGYDARAAPVANLGAKGADDWSRQLTDLLPAINACVTREGARLKAVANASPQGSSSVKVRLMSTTGAVLDCSADASGRGTPSLAAVADAPAPGSPLYYPPRDPPPLVSCGKLERVLTPRGALAGYLHYDPC
jgi:hypothetical protein